MTKWKTSGRDATVFNEYFTNISKKKNLVASTLSRENLLTLYEVFRFIYKYRRHKKMTRLTEALCGPLNSKVL